MEMGEMFGVVVPFRGNLYRFGIFCDEELAEFVRSEVKLTLKERSSDQLKLMIEVHSKLRISRKNFLRFDFVV